MTILKDTDSWKLIMNTFQIEETARERFICAAKWLIIKIGRQTRRRSCCRRFRDAFTFMMFSIALPFPHYIRINLQHGHSRRRRTLHCNR